MPKELVSLRPLKITKTGAFNQVSDSPALSREPRGKARKTPIGSGTFPPPRQGSLCSNPFLHLRENPIIVYITHFDCRTQVDTRSLAV